MPAYSPLNWHFLVHSHVCSEHLRIFFIRFEPQYPKGESFELIEQACKEFNVSSYAIYEVYGPIDLIFVAWIRNSDRRKFHERLVDLGKTIRGSVEMEIYDNLDVEELNYHWLWDPNRGNSLDGDLLCPSPSDLSAISEQGISATLAQNGGVITDSLVPEIETLEHQHLIRRHPETGHDEIFFFVFVTPPPQGINDAVKQDLLRRICDAARSIDGVRCKVIYSGQGPHLWCAIEATAHFNDYVSISELQENLNSSGISAHRIKTETFLCTNPAANALSFDAINITIDEYSAVSTYYEKSVSELISQPESGLFEYKSSARVDDSGSKQLFVEEAVVKTVAAFLNTKGGVLLIGVDDNGRIVGIERDFAALRKKDRDGYELWLRELFYNWFLERSIPVNVGFESLGGKDVCRVDVRPSDRPIFANKPKSPKSDTFYIREGNSTKRLSMSEALQYIKDRFTGQD